jgi:hypothetical protein
LIYKTLRANGIPLRHSVAGTHAPRSTPIVEPTPVADWNDLSVKSVDQISAFMSACARLMELYAENVATAQERFRKEREFLAMLTVEYERMARHIAERSANALAAASGIETRQGGNEVPSRSDESPTGAAGDAQKDQPQ